MFEVLHQAGSLRKPVSLAAFRFSTRFPKGGNLANQGHSSMKCISNLLSGLGFSGCPLQKLLKYNKISSLMFIPHFPFIHSLRTLGASSRSPASTL